MTVQNWIHVWYKVTPCLQNKLDFCTWWKVELQKNYCEEALSYDKRSVGVFKKDESLVSQIPIELPRLDDYFIKKNKENLILALVEEPRKREVRLVVPAKFTDVTKELTVVTTLLKEI